MVERCLGYSCREPVNDIGEVFDAGRYIGVHGHEGVARKGKVTKEGDVYSFGMLVLVVMCGKRVLEVGAIEQGADQTDRIWRAHQAWKN